jgi:hypothetical protein
MNKQLEKRLENMMINNPLIDNLTLYSNSVELLLCRNKSKQSLCFSIESNTGKLLERELSRLSKLVGKQVTRIVHGGGTVFSFFRDKEFITVTGELKTLEDFINCHAILMNMAKTIASFN